jgi:hypothetical protein
MTEPWLFAGLPDGLTGKHFQVAATVWVSHASQRCGDDELRPLLGDGGTHFVLSGMHHENNTARIAALGRMTPLTTVAGLSRMPEGDAAIYPVVLVHDPSPAQDGATPVGVCGPTGYIGSAWGAHRSVAAQVPPRIDGRFLVTVAALAFGEPGPRGKVWLPTPDTPR